MKKRLSNSDWIALSVFFLVLILLAAWTIDISVSALLSGGFLTNGFFVNNPTKMYHVGLYIIILVSFSNFLILLHITIRDSEKKADEN